MACVQQNFTKHNYNQNYFMAKHLILMLLLPFFSCCSSSARDFSCCSKKILWPGVRGLFTADPVQDIEEINSSLFSVDIRPSIVIIILMNVSKIMLHMSDTQSIKILHDYTSNILRNIIKVGPDMHILT